MKTSRFNDTQILGILKQAEGGLLAANSDFWNLPFSTSGWGTIIYRQGFRLIKGFPVVLLGFQMVLQILDESRNMPLPLQTLVCAVALRGDP